MYPNPHSNQQGGPFGFANSTQQRPGEGPGYPLMPGQGFPCPPNPSYPPVPNAYPSASYPSMSATQPMPSQRYPSASPVNEYGASAYGTASYPNEPSSMYPPSQNSAPFGSNKGSAMPYPPNPGSTSPYHPNAGSAYSSSGSPYPANAGNSPYPPNIGDPSPHSAGSVQYPSHHGPVPYSSGAPQTGPYSPSSGGLPPHQSPYPPTGPQGYAPKMSETSYSSYASTPPSISTQGYGSAGATWPYQERATVRPAISFDPSSDAGILRKAMKGFGTDEKAITAVLGRRTSQQRQQIMLKYQQAFGKDLIKDLKSELSGRFEYIVLALMTPLPDFLAQELSNAIRGAGTNERTLIEIICTSDNQTIRAIKTVYASKFKRPLENDLRGDLSGDVQHLLIANATGSRDENNNDTSVAPRLAQSLYDAGVKKKYGTDESEFIRILSCYSYPVLRCVFSEYAKITGKSLESSIISETSGYFKTGLLALYHVAFNRASYFAKELNDAMKGAGTKDNNLVRIIVSRSEIDMGNIKDEYHKLFGKRLEDAVSGEVSGDYKSLLLTLIQG